jgi:hypothetical protein
MQQSAVLGLGTTIDQCEGAEFGPVETVIYTTGIAMATKGEDVITVTGESFDCSAFTQTDGAGMIVQPSAVFNPLAPGGDVANGSRFADNPMAP